MEKEDSFDVMSSSSGSRDRNNGNGRLSWSRRTAGQGNRGWSRISLGGLGSARRREKEPKVLVSRASPRRLTLGGEAMGAGGTTYYGKHGIRYKQPFAMPMTEEMAEELKLEESSKDQATSLLASPPLKRLPGLEADTITEEGDLPREDGDGERQVKDNDGRKGSAGVDEDANRSKHGHRRANTNRGVRLLDLRIDNGIERMGSGALRTVSPSSRRGSGSPGPHSDNRPRTQSWAPEMASPVLSGPFSRFRSRSRSPRRRFSMALAPTLDSLPVLHGEMSRLSSGGSEKATANDPSVCTVEEYLGWGDGEPLVAASGDGDGDGVEDSKEGAFTDSALMMARLRLPNMDLGYEMDGFFGIDVRSLIIEKEIARGAYGVVYEGVLLPHPPEEEGGGDGDGDGGDRSGANREAVDSSKADPEVKAPSSATASSEAVKLKARAGVEGASEGGAGVAEEKSTVREGDEATAGGRVNQEQGTKVAVKIQQVPEDEEEQANLLGELGVLRNYKHPNLVEFIGAAMAVERGADTVMVAMELCTNGALREALKLNISWPLKVRIAMDFTDGLKYLHQHDIIHRDIKTPNVLIDGSWRAKLCDYNFAIDEKSSIKQEFCAGTMEFMSPEILMSEDYGLASDVFSLGIIFVEMLTGKEPAPEFPQRTPQAFFAVNEDEIQAEILPDCPASFSMLQSQCLFYEASDRPTAEDVHSWLQEVLDGIGEENVTIPQKEPPLPVLTEGAAIAREGNVVNTSPKQESGHHWFDSDSMEHHVGSMMESVVDRVLTEKLSHLGVAGLGNVVDSENSARLEEMKAEIKTLRAACEERDSRIASLEVEVMRNTKTFKMLSSALEVAYSKMQTQQALVHANSELPPVGGVDLQGDESTERNGLAEQEA